jgi:NADPH:quinone reductase-like Zn-dependent oxidoreductase
MQALCLVAPTDQIEQLCFMELPTPNLDDHSVLIQVQYASINPVDHKLIAHKPPFWSYPYIVGLDCVGIIVKVGAKVTRVKLNDIVACHGDLTYGGAIAQYVAKPQHVVYRIPNQFNLAFAASTPCAGLTAYLALVRKMHIKIGKTILIQAGSGGVGGFAILIAKHFGLTVISTTSTKNLAYVKSLGADIVLDYTQQDIYAEIKTLYPAGIDYILETTNKPNLTQDISILAFNGHIASIVGILPTIDIPEFTIGFSFHEIALGGAYLAKHYSSESDLAQMGEELCRILLPFQDKINLTIFPFEAAIAAMDALKQNQSPGKIIIKVS